MVLEGGLGERSKVVWNVAWAGFNKSNKQKRLPLGDLGELFVWVLKGCLESGLGMWFEGGLGRCSKGRLEGGLGKCAENGSGGSSRVVCKVVVSRWFGWWFKDGLESDLRRSFEGGLGR